MDARQEADDVYWIMGIDEAGRGRESIPARMQAKQLQADRRTDTPLVAAFFRATPSSPHCVSSPGYSQRFSGRWSTAQRTAQCRSEIHCRDLDSMVSRPISSSHVADLR